MDSPGNRIVKGISDIAKWCSIENTIEKRERWTFPRKLNPVFSKTCYLYLMLCVMLHEPNVLSSILFSWVLPSRRPLYSFHHWLNPYLSERLVAHCKTQDLKARVKYEVSSTKVVSCSLGLVLHYIFCQISDWICWVLC